MTEQLDIEILTRLRAATGPGRGMDAEIAEAMGIAPLGFTREKSNGQPACWWRCGEITWQPPEFTADINAALTLVPEGYWWSVGSALGPNPVNWNLFRASVFRPDGSLPLPYSVAATPALALCIAALTARETR